MLGATLLRIALRSEVTGTRDIRTRFLGAGESSATQLDGKFWHPEQAAVRPSRAVVSAIESGIVHE